MRLGISSFAYSWAVGVAGSQPAEARTSGKPMAPADLLDAAAALGVGVVQYGDNLPLGGLSRAEVEGLRARADELGLSIELGVRTSRPAELVAGVELAAALGSPVLRLVTDTADDQPSEDEIVRRLRQVLPACAAKGVVLAVENHGRFTAATMASLILRLDSPHAGICLDTANSLGLLEGYRETVEALAPLTVNLHVKDVAARRVPSQLGLVIEGVPAGRGMVDLPWVVETVREAAGAAGRKPNAILELWTPPGPDLAATVAREADWARESVEYLRTLIAD